MPLSPVDVENQRKLREFDVPTFGYRRGEDGGVEKEIFDGEIPEGWVDSPAKVNDLPLISKKERPIALEVRAMISAGKKNTFISTRFHGIDSRFIERVRADPSTLKEDLIARRAARKWRNVEKWVKKNPPALPTEWQELPEPHVTLCEAVTRLATGALESAKWLRERGFDPGSRADMLVWEQIEMAQRLVEEGAADDDLWLFGQKETSSGEPSGKDERLPASAFLARDPKLAAKMDLAHDAITIGSTRYVSVSMRRKDLLKLWPACMPGVPDSAKVARALRDDGSQKITIGEIAVRILETHRSSPSVDLETVIRWLFEQVEPPNELCVLFQDVPASEDGGVSEFWFKYYGDKENKSVVERGDLVSVSTEEMTRFCDSAVFREWASMRGLGAPASFDDEAEPAQVDMLKSDLELWSGGVTRADAEYDEKLAEVLRPAQPHPPQKGPPARPKGAETASTTTIATVNRKKKLAGRPKGAGSLATKDAPLIKEMRKLTKGKDAISPYAAAMKIADRAAGGGTLESKAKRLVKRFSD